MKRLTDFINEGKGDFIFGDMKSTSVFSSLILYAANNFGDFMKNLNLLEGVDELPENEVKKILQNFDNEISAELGAEDSDLSFKN